MDPSAEHDYLDAKLLNALSGVDGVAERVAPYGASKQAESGFAELRVWQAAVDLLKDAYRVSPKLPPNEQFGARSQLQRAALSVSNNIAEGWGRNSRPDFARFVDIALGSACEVRSILLACVHLSFLETSDLLEPLENCDKTCRLLHRLRQAVRST